MVNFDDMTLEELQKLLSVNTKNPDEVKRIQEISGLTGKAVDGIWGKQTSKAWNNFLDKNERDIVQAISDEKKYQNAIARGQSSPAVEDLVSFSNQLDEQQQARNAKIAQLEQQIAQVKERIVRNERTLTGKSYEDANKKLATLEMDKIGVRLNRQPAQSDPTMLWRWNQGRLDTQTANDNVKSKEAAKFANTVDMWVNTRPAPTTEGIMQQISNINSAIRDGKNAGADVSKLETKKDELEALVYGGDITENSTKYGAGTDKEQLAGLLKTTLTNAKTSTELTTFKKQHPQLTPEQLSSVDTKIAELQKKEKANSESEKFNNWLKARGFKNGSKGISQKILATLKRQYEANK